MYKKLPITEYSKAKPMQSWISFYTGLKIALFVSHVVLSLNQQVLPNIIFFSSVISVLYYVGIMQLIIKKIAWLMRVTMSTSGVESLSAAGNIFIGQVLLEMEIEAT